MQVAAGPSIRMYLWCRTKRLLERMLGRVVPDGGSRKRIKSCSLRRQPTEQ